MRERKLRPEEEAYLGPVAVAVFVDIGWLRGWPLTATRTYEKARRNGYGRDRLPYYTERSETGAYCWEGRRA